jgi:hypothetical protein
MGMAASLSRADIDQERMARRKARDGINSTFEQACSTGSPGRGQSGSDRHSSIHSAGDAAGWLLAAAGKSPRNAQNKANRITGIGSSLVRQFDGTPADHRSARPMTAINSAIFLR